MLQAKNNEQKSYVERICKDNPDVIYALKDGLKVNGYISYDEMERIVEYLGVAKQKMREADFQRFKESELRAYNL